MNIKDSVVKRLNIAVGSTVPLEGENSVFIVNKNKINIRTASQKSGDKYWFDVTPAFYENNKVDFFIYACGSSEQIYIFPLNIFIRMIQGASLGGQKQVPNFTIYLDKHEFEPAGRADSKYDISQYYNKLSLIP